MSNKGRLSEISVSELREKLDLLLVQIDDIKKNMQIIEASKVTPVQVRSIKTLDGVTPRIKSFAETFGSTANEAKNKAKSRGRVPEMERKLRDVEARGSIKKKE